MQGIYAHRCIQRAAWRQKPFYAHGSEDRIRAEKELLAYERGWSVIAYDVAKLATALFFFFSHLNFHPNAFFIVNLYFKNS
jgi:hypothetical protein